MSLNYAGGRAYSNAYFHTGSGPIFLDDVQCTSSTSQLLECPSRPILSHNCLHSADAGVGCEGNVTYRISLIRCHGYYFLLLLLIEGGYYSVFILLGSRQKDWIRYMRAIQLGLIDPGSTTCSLSVLLLAVEMSLWSQTALEIAL